MMRLAILNLILAAWTPIAFAQTDTNSSSPYNRRHGNADQQVSTPRAQRDQMRNSYRQPSSPSDVDNRAGRLSRSNVNNGVYGQYQPRWNDNSMGYRSSRGYGNSGGYGATGQSDTGWSQRYSGSNRYGRYGDSFSRSELRDMYRSRGTGQDYSNYGYRGDNYNYGYNYNHGYPNPNNYGNTGPNYNYGYTSPNARGQDWQLYTGPHQPYGGLNQQYGTGMRNYRYDYRSGPYSGPTDTTNRQQGYWDYGRQ